MNIHMHTKAALRWKRFSDWVHEYKFSPVCLFLWTFNCSLCVNRLSHTVHKYGFGLSSAFFLHHSWFTIAAPCVYTGNKCVINCIVMSWIAMYDTEELKMKSTGRVFHTSEVSCEVKVWLHFIITSTKCYWSQCRSVIICWEIVYHRLRGSASPVLTTTHHSYVNMSLHSKLSTLNYRRTWHWIIAVY